MHAWWLIILSSALCAVGIIQEPHIAPRVSAMGNFEAPEQITLRRGRVPFAQDGYTTYYSMIRRDRDDHAIGRGSVGYDHLVEKFKVGVHVKYALRNGEKVALSGGVYTASCGENSASLRRILNKELPKELTPILVDSFTIPLERADRTWATVDGIYVNVQKIKQAGAPNQSKSMATMRVAAEKLLKFATIKEGEILLIGGSGFLARGIVPYDEATGIAGWVEFAAQPIPEADLIRDKKAFVRPMAKQEDKEDTKEPAYDQVRKYLVTDQWGRFLNCVATRAIYNADGCRAETAVKML